jgi:hypothetical protein
MPQFPMARTTARESTTPSREVQAVEESAFLLTIVKPV